jgi:hypothetical protein
MANSEHLKILKQGVEIWNEWRRINPEITPDLSDSKLLDTKLPAANLTEADLSKSNLCDADLSAATLVRANLSHSDLFFAQLGNANLEYANLNHANLSSANLENANLMHTDLRWTNFDTTELKNADLSGSTIGATKFIKADLSEVRGLASLFHHYRSIIDIDTIYRSRDKLPDEFLRGCGLPESFIVQIPSLIGALQPLQFYSCFISYSSKDQPFADRLYIDLQNKGVRCWFAPEDMKIGDEIRSRIDESIRLSDKLLLVLSRNSVSSWWVKKEVETAMEWEAEQNHIMLFPVRLDNSIMEMKSGWPADIRRTRHIGDFTDWKNHDLYTKALARLLRDLKAGASNG